jgi:hypothetical protein
MTLFARGVKCVPCDVDRWPVLFDGDSWADDVAASEVKAKKPKPQESRSSICRRDIQVIEGAAG